MRGRGEAGSGEGAAGFIKVGVAVNGPALGYGVLQNGRASRGALLYAGRQEVIGMAVAGFSEAERRLGEAWVSGRDVMAHRLAHELGNALAPIATAAAMLVRQAPDERDRQLGRIIERHALQLRAVVGEWIALASSGADPARSGGGPLAGAPRAIDALNDGGGPAWPCSPLGGAPGLTGSDATGRSGPSAPALRILVVDDNADAAQLLGLFLQSLGHEVCVLSDPLVAVAVAAQFKPQIGLLDIAMPGLNGHELARRLLGMPTSVNLKLAAVTAYSHASERQAAVCAGFERYFVKPLNVNALQEWLEQSQLGLAA